MDEWLSSKWDSVARSYIDGEDLQTCVRSSRDLLETVPVPEFEGIPEGEGDDALTGQDAFSINDELKELLNSNIF